MCVAKSSVDVILSTIENATIVKDGLAGELSKVDKEISQTYHEIEVNRFNASEGFYYAKRLQHLLVKRRRIKNEMMNMNTLQQMVNLAHFKDKVSKAKKRIDQHLDQQAEYLQNVITQ